MTALEKAELQVLNKRGRATATHPVQFNPATMQLQMANSIDGSKSRPRQQQQYNGTSTTTLSLDLEYDTADEGTTAEPSDVRSKTQDVRQFVLPGGANSKQAPPRVKFRWGTFELSGVMASLTEELTLFSSDGVPLRSKVSIQIKEQDPKFEALERGPGANPDTSPPPAGEDTGADAANPGGDPDTGGPVDSVANALDGETPADFLARQGLAPEAWRALGNALDTLGEGLELSAGASIGFSANLGVGLGLGVSVGFGADLDIDIGAALGLEVSTSSGGRNSGRSSELRRGMALSAAGGLTAANETALAHGASEAANAARTNFAEGGGDGSTAGVAGSGSGAASRQPLSLVASGAGLRTGAALPAADPPSSDRRETTFGKGVPLRNRVSPQGVNDGCYVVIGRPSPAAITAVPSTGRRPAPWEQLERSSVRAVSDREQQARQPSCGCLQCDPLGRG